MDLHDYIDIPRDAPSANSTTINDTEGSRCCCGDSCATHGERSVILQGLEKDVGEAARVGQALLIRHETYIADAEAERLRMSSHISTLETSNRDLEARNTTLVIENKALTEQVEDVNNAVDDAETQVKTLTAALHNNQRELDRTRRLTHRTADLEAQLLDCEQEQSLLQANVTRTIEDERAANQRWRASERRIAELEQEVLAIEREAKQERAHHEEEVARLSRRKVVEDELDTSTNATTGLHPGHERGSEVVSSFVKEILQDNANMQLAMSELRDMLAFYKDAQQSPPDLEPPQVKRHLSLGEELGMTDAQRQEYHVHHHYHAPDQPARSRSAQTQRPRKVRRPTLMSGRSSGRSTPVNTSLENARPIYRHKAASSTSSSNLSESFHAPDAKRWSAQSTQTLRSDASSPQSTSYCPSTIFEKAFGDDDTEESQPTTPEWSPVLQPRHGKASVDEGAFQSLSLPEDDPFTSNLHCSQETIMPAHIGPPTPDPQSHQPPSPSPRRSPTRQGGSPTRRTLRRTDSHASLVSISGMDIHTTIAAPTPPSFSLAGRQHSSTAVTTATAAAISRSDGSAQLQRSLRGRLAPVTESNTDRYDPITDTFGNFKRMGGWLSGRWKGGSSNDLRSRAAVDAIPGVAKRTTTPSIPEDVQDPPGTLKKASTTGMDSAASIGDGDITPRGKTSLLAYRPPGINQSGGLPPLPQPKKAWMRGKLDEEALRECLNE